MIERKLKTVSNTEEFRESTFRQIDEACEIIAVVRRAFILNGESTEEIDKYIADKGNEWVQKTGGMSEIELSLFWITKAIQQKEKEKQEDE